MDKITAFWYKRRSDYWSMANRYWRLIGKNSGLMFTLYALFIVGSIYYKKWLEMLPADFPGALVITAFVGIFVFHTPLRTFIEAADLVFLLPLEARLKPYFRKSLKYNMWIQGSIVAAAAIIVSPLFLAAIYSSPAAFFGFLILALFLKQWNIYAHWLEQYFGDVKSGLKLFRAAGTFLTLYAVLSGILWLTAIFLVIIAAGHYVIFYAPSKNRLLKWEGLVELDERQLRKLLRFANLFTDVPEMRGRVHRRQWLSNSVGRLSFNKKNLYVRYFSLTFIRANDYLGLWFRLFAIGIILIFGYQSGYAPYFIGAAVVYLTGLQIFPLWHHPAPQATFHLYPLPAELKKAGFKKVISAALLGQALLISIAGAIAVGTVKSLVVFLIITILIAILFVFTFVNRRIEKG